MGGLVRGITNTLGITRDKSGERAAGEAALGSRNAIQEVRDAFGVTEKDLQPFVTAGAESLPLLQEGTTPEGLDSILGRIFGTESFRNLVGERERAATNLLSATGQTRSGAGLLEAARIPLETGFQIENLLNQRLAESAQTGLNTALNLGTFREGKSTNIAGLLRNIGLSNAQRELAEGQSRRDQASNLFRTATGVAAQLPTGGISQGIGSFSRFFVG